MLHIITGLNDGGAEAVLYRLCVHDHQNSHTVISLMDDGKYGALLREIGVAVYCLNMPQGRVTITGVWRCWLLLRSLNVNLIQTWMYHADLLGGVLARLAGKTAIAWGVHNSALEVGKAKNSTIIISKINAFLSRIIPKMIVYCAKKSREVHEFLGYVRSKGVVVPNGYNLDLFSPMYKEAAILKSELGINSQTVVLGTVARFDPDKDHLNLIQSLSVLKEKNMPFKCLLVGKDMTDSNVVLCQWLDKFQVKENCLLLGQRSDIPIIMSLLDLHILPSSAEAFPNVLAEAMACETLCVTTDVGDASYIVGNTGWVVPRKNHTKLANAILEAIEVKKTPSIWMQRKLEARQRVINNFGIGKMINAYHQIWGNILK